MPYHPRENSCMMSLRFSIEHNISLPVAFLITASTVLHYNTQNCVVFSYSLLTAWYGLPLLFRVSVQASLLKTSLKLGNRQKKMCSSMTRRISVIRVYRGWVLLNILSWKVLRGPLKDTVPATCFLFLSIHSLPLALVPVCPGRWVTDLAEKMPEKIVFE